MNILLCHNFYRTRGGEDSVFAAELDLLQQRGHEVRTFTRDSREIDESSAVRKLSFFAQGFSSGRTRREFAHLIKQERPHVVHVHNVWPLISPALYAIAKKHGLPVVQTIHNFRFFCVNGLLMRSHQPCHLCQHGAAWHGIRHRCLHGNPILSAWYAAIQRLHRRTFRNCIDRYIVLNSFTRQVFIDAGFDPERIVVKPNATTISSRYVVDDPEPHVVFVGRLSQEKGLMTLLHAAAKVPEQPLRIIGDGPLESKARAFIADHSLSHVEMLGYRPPDEVEQFVARARACVVPSECYENCPVVLVNAFVLGTPAIVARTGGLPDFVPEGKAGWLFPPGDADALAERLRWVAAHPADIDALRPDLREWGSATFSVERNHDALMHIYRDAGADA